MRPPTAYPDVNALLETLIARMQAVLGEKLVGVYLYGSLVTGGYSQGVSDVDLLAAITSDLSEAEFAALEKMHHGVIAHFPDWGDRVEIAYLSRHGLRTFKSQRSAIAVISPGEPFNLKTAGRDWLMNWYLVREGGVALFGPPPQEVIVPISSGERMECVREHALAWPMWVKDANHLGSQAYAILTLCRALYTVTTGGHVSKQAAAEWAMDALPEWAPLIQNALAWRLASRDDAPDVDATATLDETRRFVQDVADRIRKLQET